MRSLIHFRTVIKIFAQYRIDRVLPPGRFRRSIQVVRWLTPSTWHQPKETHSPGACLRLALETLGPLFVKLGQMLSTRPDLLPQDIANELCKLQDKVPPFSSADAISVLEQAYGQKVTEIFQTFTPEPLAAASVAQVHSATLKNGKEVIVKIIRPGIEKNIIKDIRLMYRLAKWLPYMLPKTKRLRLKEVVAEFEKVIFSELDMRREAANASQLRRNFLNSALLYVPEVHWDYLKENILVIERVYGVKINEIKTLHALGVDMKKLAEYGVKIFYTQVFRDKFFHADMHPGNIFVDVTDPANPRYCGVDFGIMGSLTEEDHYYLAQNFLAFFNQDYRRLAQLHIDSGWVPRRVRVDEMEAALRTVCEPIFNKPLNEISYGKLLLHLFEVAREFDMKVQPQLILLQKTLLNVEGLGRQLYPELNLWETAKPELEKIMQAQLGLPALIKKAIRLFPQWLYQRLARH